MRVLEEYCLPAFDSPSHFTRYAGNRALDSVPEERKIGPEHAEELALPQTTIIYRGFLRRPVKLKKGQRVKRWLTIIEEITG